MMNKEILKNLLILDIQNNYIMKKIFNLILLILIIPCVLLIIDGCASEKTKSNSIYYLDEDFILVQKKEDVEVSTNVEGVSYKVRTWIIHRVNSPIDSVYVGEINCVVFDNRVNSGCKGCNFYITDELWYNKDVGDVLHFDYIRKNRFYKISKSKLEKNNLTYDYSYEISKTKINLEKEKRIMEIEKQILLLQRELETLKK